ncbi:pyridoxal-phosphate dependent enzyme [Spiroplasma phoeniceum]|uniref:Threonine dehydratase n=1 Tax=Spiroplasma phoeniceum P40 TaxID=1276259 RepID=A0A345DQ44_9MOLU|nr:pyridoxal-phosphate dependent enzyme [Spiroplasma phoeniceum]AXF96332.1 threonine dehydratase [Spiroplasma phoeniceum P40]
MPATIVMPQTAPKVFGHAFNDLDVISGQGTIAIEILEELQDFDYVLVPIGGGHFVRDCHLYQSS